MKTRLLFASFLLALWLGAPALQADSSEKQKEFTENANPMALGFYRMMMSNGAGGKISKIELVDLTPEEAKKAAGTQDGPGGIKTHLPLKPTKKLVFTVETKDENGSSSSTSESFVAEKDGRFVIPVPVDVK